MIDELRKPFDLSDVERFGELVNIASKLPSPFRVYEFRESLDKALDEANYDPYEDFILLIGRSFNLCAAIGHLAYISGFDLPGVKVLVWSATEEHYVERLI